MAVLNFSITVPDAQVANVATALKSYFSLPAATNAQLVEALRQEFIVRLKDIVRANLRQTAITVAESGNYETDAS